MKSLFYIVIQTKTFITLGAAVSSALLHNSILFMYYHTVKQSDYYVFEHFHPIE